MPLKLVAQTMGGSHIEACAKDAINLYKATGCMVEFEFNGACILICNNIQTPQSIVEAFDKWIQDKCPSSPRNILT
jgi:hypothetical protein